jgi:tetratricopeptide (TPR) repeat protein
VTDQEVYASCYELIGQGKYSSALELSSQITSSALRAAILIDAGFALGKMPAVRKGIRAAEYAVVAAQTSKPAYSLASLWYNLANGYYSLFNLRRRNSKRPIIPPNDDDIRNAKRAYRQSIAHLGKEDGSFRSQVWVNFGNCLSQFGRGIEAIECYRTALAYEPSNGMASGNLGEELVHAAAITGRYRHDYMLAARAALVDALGPQMHLRYGSQAAADHFAIVLKQVDEFFAFHKRGVRRTRPASPPSRKKATLSYIRFCQEHSLFLNAWAGASTALPARTDEVSFQPITTTFTDESTVPELLHILNEIKESFTTSRFLAFTALEGNPTLADASALTTYFQHGPKDALYGTPLGLLKAAYSQAFDVLDKVARLINVYFSIGHRRNSFWRVFVTRQSRGPEHEIRWIARPEVVDTHNFSLYALSDLAIDYFQAEFSDLSAIDERRNRMTHDYLLVLPTQGNGESAEGAISIGDLSNETIRTLRLAKNAVLYAISAMHIAESMRKKRGKRLQITYRDSSGIVGLSEVERIL